MLLEFAQRHFAMDRNAIAHYVQIVFLEINEPLAAGVLDVSIANIPLSRHGPVENSCAARHLTNFQRNLPAQPFQSATKTIARNAAADGIKLRHQRMHLLAQCLRVELALNFGNISPFRNHQPSQAGLGVLPKPGASVCTTEYQASMPGRSRT